MAAPGTDLSTGEASALTLWAVESLAATVGVEADPLLTRRLVREVFGARAQVSEALLVRALTSTAAAARLDVLPTALDEATVLQAALPLLTCAGGGAIVTQRRGSEVLLARPHQAPTWVEGRSLDFSGPWFTAVPAAPLTAMSPGGGGPHPSPSRRLLALLQLERDDLRVIVIYAMAVGLLSLATPIAVQALVSTVAFGTLLQPIVVLSLMLLVALGFRAVLEALQARVVESLQQRVFVRAAADLSWRLPRVKREVAGHDFGPETVNRFFEVLTVQKTAHTLLTDGLATAMQIAVGLMVLAFYHPALLALDLVLLALATSVVFLPFGRGLSTSIEESLAKYEVAGWLEELARPGAALRSAGGAHFAAERADALTRRYLAARRRHFHVVYGQTVSARAVQVFATVALLGLGGWLVVQQSLTLGQLVAAELIIAAVASSIGKLGKLLDATYDLLTGIDKLGHLVDLPVEESLRREDVPGQGGVRVEVRAACEGVGVPLNLEAAAGERLAVVGAERHPLAEWLAGLRRPTRGAVSLNGVELSPAVSPDIAFVQRGDFFAATVLENLTLGRVGVTTADVRAALERVGLLDDLRALPEGLDTPLAHDGAPLEHSQLTSLLVARALAGSPRLIVADESVESIDPAARARCVAALTRQGAPWTLVAVVSDPGAALARACERTVTLSDLLAKERT